MPHALGTRDLIYTPEGVGPYCYFLSYGRYHDVRSTILQLGDGSVGCIADISGQTYTVRHDIYDRYRVLSCLLDYSAI